MNRAARLLAALVVTLPLLVVIGQPAQADTCYIVSYGPGFTNSDWKYVRGSASMTCSGSSTTFMELGAWLQRRNLDGTYSNVTNSWSGWDTRNSAGQLSVFTYSKTCLDGSTHVYRTKARYSWKTIYSSTARYDLYSVPTTKECGP